MLRPTARGNDPRRKARGQTLVEFSLVLIPFLYMMMGVLDLGRGIYTNNGLAQAAREIARTASVHQCSGPCTSSNWSAEIGATIATQKKLVPGITDTSIAIGCVDITDTAQTIDAGGICPPGDFIKVTVGATFRLVTPLLPVPNPMSLSSSAHIQVPAP